jgi:hypothetical protein
VIDSTHGRGLLALSLALSGVPLTERSGSLGIIRIALLRDQYSTAVVLKSVRRTDLRPSTNAGSQVSSEEVGQCLIG